MKSLMLILGLLITLEASAYTKVSATVTGGTQAQRDRILKLIPALERAINSDDFKKGIEGFYYNKKNRFYDTALTPKQVYKALMVPEWKLKYHLKPIKKKLFQAATLGYTMPSIQTIYINSLPRYFDGRKDSGIFATLGHEQTHKLKFKHSVKYTKARDFSVPYGTGTLLAKIYPKFK